MKGTQLAIFIGDALPSLHSSFPRHRANHASRWRHLRLEAASDKIKPSKQSKGPHDHRWHEYFTTCLTTSIYAPSVSILRTCMSPTPARHIVTTTIYPYASGTVVSQPSASTVHSNSSAPIAPIVGGLVGGAVLALLVVVCWMLWGRSIDRQKAREAKELAKARETAKNTRMNAATVYTKQRATQSYLHPKRPSPGTGKVKFESDSQMEKRHTLLDPRPKGEKGEDSPVIPSLSSSGKTPVFSSESASAGTVIFPWRKRSAERMALTRQSSETLSDDGQSFHSVQSEFEGETPTPRRPKSPPPPPPERLSRSSSIWSFLARNGVRRPRSDSSGLAFDNRQSQATSASMYSQPDEPAPDMPIGVAV
ncbi:hypothetical protein CYLTODRAFT_445896 [Cylindrobasidium torrendii FP15055 ss-10]|uniref:Uncharacterized protein n=1 Tax=Cylindrobasidium torrendii FP15055 ss-10 TaxID=1314674 RepID=A0A0D7B335_9AGAR|nr:hypothetical protein CYLTODRAFT_445896 [Cylindrobasidium torrendii FP15055 ss-10]